MTPLNVEKLVVSYWPAVKGYVCAFLHLEKRYNIISKICIKKTSNHIQNMCLFISWFSNSPFDDVCHGGTLMFDIDDACHNAPPVTFPLSCYQCEALRQVLVNRYYGNFKPGGRRDSLTNFSNGPLTPGGQTKTPTGLCSTRWLPPRPLSSLCYVSYIFRAIAVARRQECDTCISCVNSLQTNLLKKV